MENQKKAKIALIKAAVSAIALAGIGLDSTISNNKSTFLGRLKDVKIYLLEVIGKIKESKDDDNASLLSELEDFLTRVSSIIIKVEKTNKYKLFIKGIFVPDKELKKLKSDIDEFEKKYRNRGI